jgi:hypothetical protein
MANKKPNNIVEVIVEELTEDELDAAAFATVPAEIRDADFETLLEAAVPLAKETYTADEGDTYPSIAGAFKPAGMTKHEYAKHLFAINGGRNITAGVEIKL